MVAAIAASLPRRARGTKSVFAIMRASCADSVSSCTQRGCSAGGWWVCGTTLTARIHPEAGAENYALGAGPGTALGHLPGLHHRTPRAEARKLIVLHGGA